MSTQNIFSATVGVDAATVRIDAPSLTLLQQLLGRLGHTTAAPVAASGEEKAAVAGNAQATQTPTAAPTAKPTPAPRPAATPAPTAPTATAAPATAAQGAVSYDDVKKVVNALYAINAQHAVDALAKFQTADGEPVKNGKELQPQQWLEFVEAGRAQLATLQAQVPA